MNFRIEEKLPVFEVYGRVIYIPLHAYGDTKHPDCEVGFVSSSNEKYIFVKFVKQLSKFGWSGTTSQACDPSDLKITNGFWPHVTH